MRFGVSLSALALLGASLITGATPASSFDLTQNTGDDNSLDTPNDSTTTEDDGTLTVTAGAPGSLTIVDQPTVNGSGAVVLCGWYDVTSLENATAVQVDPVDGGLYILWCRYAELDQTLPGYPFVTTYSGPDLPGDAISTAEAAQYAVDQIVFESPLVKLSPVIEQIVGVPTWLAVTSETQFAPVTAQAGPVWATARPEFRDVVWDLGDGSDPITCTGDATTTWNNDAPDDRQSDCSHTYQQSSLESGYEASATITWTIFELTDKSDGTWQVWGTVSLTSSVTIAVGELQAVIR